MNVRADSGLDASELDYNRSFAGEEELARYVVEETPVYGIHESLGRSRDLEALERGQFGQVLRNRGVHYDLA